MKKLLLIAASVIFTTANSFGQFTVLDDFEAGTAGHFSSHTTYSGSTAGILSTTPELEPSVAFHGIVSLRIVLIDDPASSSDWAVRFLSGLGSPASNVAMAPNGWTGFYLRTDRSWLRTAPMIDAPGTAEIGDTLNVIGDDTWHAYQWNLGVDGPPHWTGWITGNDSISDDPTPTYDGIWFFAPDGSDTTVVFLDYVVWNPSGVVPVELVSFTYSINGNNVELRWITATETNNAGFEVERKAEGGAFQNIGFVEGQGTVTKLNTYTYSDIVGKLGTYYYRLKQVDFDGSFEYSAVIQVDVSEAPADYALRQNYPNPFNPTTTINYQIPEAGIVTLSVYNLLGEKIADLVNEFKETGAYNVSFNARDLASGIYIYTLNVNGTSISKKMQLMK